MRTDTCLDEDPPAIPVQVVAAFAEGEGGVRSHSLEAAENMR